MARETIKEGLTCPLCASRGTAVAKLDAKQRPYIYGANCCNAQLFSRSADQAARMRKAWGLPDAAAAPVSEKSGSGLVMD